MRIKHDNVQMTGGQNVSVKGQMVNILGFACHTVPIAVNYTTLLLRREGSGDNI